ncbi:molybdopterin molybdotransferase MoeA [Acetobacter orleanensis]|uniref:Molybdopterin molybdenumtransferase n=1 Tax=Acetobacter orleanensis TaxID=104099 RepID=A0A4Y3TLM1_9PROT|nr:gephyrin-like molybdotransferase Glp [Acetobacter orleanensis]KXV62041.1 molybdenum cofactor biosynthesis protein MoaA [Acetobacter orleanensis]PCD80375.1 molybdopterin molybdenumtransferase MoeA [Acetobacter orleanensis]GAN68867.1 molybdopterin biosynthesis protein MoeA [Acetobacter orleanensis JCM 7639]GBR30908.1 molybdopterin biosynthesis protein MoeA [Acetobacter orleanensis NRIC 0473]GEB81725.1 molybdopterin molybdenumtransferase MoeA [Acetobacter orleanensis]
MLDVAVARARILEKFSACGLETVSLAAGCGRVLAAPLIARLSNPPVSVSSMDGYALKAEDAQEGATLRILGEAPAGHPSSLTVEKGTCLRLFTGSQIPTGADMVMIQENVQRDGEYATLLSSGRAGQFIRKEGQDFRKGDILAPAGKTIGPRDIGLAAAGGHIWLPVSRRPRIGVLATGDEIVLPGDPASADSIVNSGAFMITALLNSLGAEAILLPVARDNAASLSASIGQAHTLDLLVTIGGASVGTYDVVRSTLEAHGLDLNFWKIAMRPGKPLMFGQLGRTPVIGLPGNPVAALVCSLVFIAPALKKLLGQPVPEEMETEAALLGAEIGQNDQRQDFVRCRLTPQGDGQLPLATPFSSQDSAQLNIFAQSQALLIRAPFAAAEKAGAPCRILRLP